MTKTIPSADVQFQGNLAAPLGGNTYLLAVSGLLGVEIKGESGQWTAEEIEVEVPLYKALEATQRKPEEGNALAFDLHQWAPLVTPATFYDLNQAVNFGISIEPFSIDWHQGEPRWFIDLKFTARVRDVDAFLLTVGFMLVLVGDVVEVPAKP